MTEAVQIALIVATPPTLLAAGSVYAVIRSDRRQAKADEERKAANLEAAKKVAAEVKAVKTALAESDSNTTTHLNRIEQVGENTHQLVNGSLTAQMKIGAVALRRLAVNTGHPDDVAAAELAEKALAEHVGKQAIMHDNK